MDPKHISEKKSKKLTAANAGIILTGMVWLLLLIYMGLFVYLNMVKYTQHVDSDIAAEALLSREIWVEKDLAPDSWISSTERRIVAVPALSSLFYGMSGSMVFSMGISCVIVGGLLLASIAFTLKRCGVSRLGTATALLALCALPINGLRNDGQMVPFVMLLWFLFAGYYAMHCICLFLCIAFYLYLRNTNFGSGSEFSLRTDSEKKASAAHRQKLFATGMAWFVLTAFCGGLSLSGMRCLQVVALPLLVWEILLLFFESSCMAKPLPRKRWVAAGFILSLLAAGILAMFYPSHKDYSLYIETADLMVDRLTHHVPAAVLECLGIAGNCSLTSFAAMMQLGILAVVAMTLYGLSFMKKFSFAQRALIQALGASFLLTVFIETVTSAETASNYFFVIWFVIIAVFAALITHFEKAAPHFAKLIVGAVCIFALCNLLYTYRDCVTAEDNLREYEEVITYMDSRGIDHGYAEFWDASRICLMTDGRITMGHCYRMEDLCMYWWLTSTKWYVPSLPEQMSTAYVVEVKDKEKFEAQFEDSSIVTCEFENDRFAVYTSDFNLVPMLQ